MPSEAAGNVGTTQPAGAQNASYTQPTPSTINKQANIMKQPSAHRVDRQAETPATSVQLWERNVISLVIMKAEYVVPFL